MKTIVITGPTACGKSDIGIKLAQKFNGEIISADSRQVYKKMDIGTGKVIGKTDFSNYVESNYKVESFEREKLSVYKVFQIEIYGDEYKRYADIVVYPLNDEVYAIEIKMRFLFTDYPDSIVDDH